MRLNPDAVAIAAPGRDPLTYGGLWQQVEVVTKHLAAMGINRNDRVGMLIPNGPEMAVALLAVATCATAAPLNPDYRAAEFDFYLEDLRAKAMIIASGIDSPAFAAAQRRNIPVIELLPLTIAEAGIFKLTGKEFLPGTSDRFPQLGDVALLLHTSGTTARPKKVPLTHKNICVAARSIATFLSLAANDRCLNVMPLFHVHGLIGTLLASLTAGASVVCPPVFNAPSFFDWLDELHPTWYTAVPAIHLAVMSEGVKHRETIRRASLRFIRSSSAPLPAQLAANLEQLFKVPVIEAYGMTEASHQITSNPLPPGKRKTGSVGISAGPEVRIIRATGEFAPSGQRGEVVIRGANVSRGYESGSGVNVDTLIDGWFRTGDEGYLDEDGYLFLAGRLKEIINRGGEKISPREIEDILLKHPGISQAVTFPVPHPTLGEDVAAAVVLEPKSQLTESSIQDYLAGRIAEFKIPHRLLILDDLPTSPTGKVTRVELARRLLARNGGELSTFRNEIESFVAEIYADVLETQEIGTSDNFFELGGDSVRATQVINRVRVRFGVNFSVALIFRNPTVARLANEIFLATNGGGLR